LRPTLSSGLPLSSNRRLKRTVTAETIAIKMPAGSINGHSRQELDLKRNTFKLARKKCGVSVVSAQKDNQAVISVTYL